MASIIYSLTIQNVSVTTRYASPGMAFQFRY